MAEFASKGVGNTALGLSIGALGVQLLKGGLGGLLNGVQPQQMQQPQQPQRCEGGAEAAAILAPIVATMAATARGGCNEDHTVTRYDAAKDARIAELETEVKLRDANTYTDQKLLEVYKHFDHKFEHVERQLCDQAVWNTAQTGTISCMAQQIAAMQGLTKTVIPAASICPEVMPRYNSWTAPAAPTTTTT